MIANVNEQVWIDYDLDIAVFLDTIAYWIKKNAANKQERNFHEGRYWTYNSQEAFLEMFPGWKRETIRRIIRNCVKHDLLIVGNFNKKSYDRTGWYSLTDKAVEYYSSLREIMAKPADNLSPASCVGINQPLVGINQTIPKLLPTSSNNTITTISESEDSQSNSNSYQEEYDYYSNYDQGSSEGLEGIDSTDFMLKSDYQNNQAEKCSSLINIDQNVDKSKYGTRSSRKSNPSEKSRASKLLWEMISVYREVFPNNPQPHATLIATSLEKTLRTLIKRWPEADPKSHALDIDSFRRYLEHLRLTAPKFALGEYLTTDGNKKKNNMETFCRWNTFVKVLEGQYS